MYVMSSAAERSFVCQCPCGSLLRQADGRGAVTSTSTDLATVDPAALVAAAEHPAQAVLALLEQARAWLVEAGSVRQVADFIGKAEAIRAYTVQRKLGTEAEFAACELKTQAERRIGELLAAEPPKRTGRPAESSPADGPLSLADHGITKNESSESQQLAAIPKPEFDKAIEDVKAEGKRPTRQAVLNRSKATAERRARKQANAEQYAQELEDEKEWRKTFPVLADPERALTDQHIFSAIDDLDRAVDGLAAVASPARFRAAVCDSWFPDVVADPIKAKYLAALAAIRPFDQEMNR